MNKDFPHDLLITATCASGVECVLKKEIERLGYGEHPAENGAITFSGDMFSVAEANINLRTAERVYIKVAEFTAETFDQMFDGTKNTKWEDFIPKNAKIIVNGKCVKSKIFAISDSQKIIKKAIADRLCGVYKINYLPEDDSTYEVDFSLYKDKLTLLLNTSGTGLHKRGYRDLVGIAPIKETLASSLLLMSDFYYKRPFFDPFCGSGTFVIEGAMIALNIAPGINRKFAFNDWKNFDENAYTMALEKAKDNEKRDREINFCGSDVDPKAIKIAKHHALNAKIGEKVKFFTSDIKDFSPKTDVGTIVCNPPYGKRVYDKKEAEECYKNLGDRLKNYPGWSAFVITEANNFEKCFGRRADRNKKFYNSNIECRYYFYYGKNLSK